MLYKDYVERKTANAIRVNSAEGYPCVFDNSKGRPLKDYKIYGNSTQDGRPTPDNPIEIQSVGDLVTDAASEYYGKYAVPVKVCGNNLLDETAFGKFTNWKKAEYGETTGGFNRFKVNCKPNTVYTVWLENQNDKIDFAAWGDDKKTIQPSKMWQIRSYESGVLYFRANVYNQDILDDVINKTGNIQVIEGAYTAYTMPPYEPYHKPITTHIYLNEPLRKVGDYADYIDFKRDKIARNVVELNLLSKQVAELYTYNGMVGIRTNPILRERMYRRGGKCNRLESSNIGYFSNKNSMWLGVNSLIIYWIGILDTLGISTLNEFKEWLDNNPTYIYYGIDASVEEDISLPSLKTLQGTNIISVATEIEPSNIEVKYIAK